MTVWRATEKNGASVVIVRNILWKNVWVVTTYKSVPKKLWNRIEPVEGPLGLECAYALIFETFLCLQEEGEDTLFYMVAERYTLLLGLCTSTSTSAGCNNTQPGTLSILETQWKRKSGKSGLFFIRDSFWMTIPWNSRELPMTFQCLQLLPPLERVPMGDDADHCGGERWQQMRLGRILE